MRRRGGARRRANNCLVRYQNYSRNRAGASLVVAENPTFRAVRITSGLPVMHSCGGASSHYLLSVRRTPQPARRLRASPVIYGIGIR